MEKNNFLKLTPMLLHEVSKPFNDNNYIFELKFDGLRCLIYIDNGEIIIKSRRNIILNNIYPELLEIKNITNEKCIFDGEIVLFENDKPSFSRLQERARLKNKNRINYMIENYPVTFVCFDILYKNKDLTNMPLIDRKHILNKFKNTNYFVKTKYYEGIGKDLFEFVKKENLEGIIAKKKNSLYTYNKRIKDWIKIKNFKLEAFYICGYIDIEKNNIITLILGEKINNDFRFVGKVILGKKDNLYKIIKKEKETKNYLTNFCEIEVSYIKSKYKVDVYYMERTKNNLLRQPFIKK